jgi:hypothetical protein
VRDVIALKYSLVGYFNKIKIHGRKLVWPKLKFSHKCPFKRFSLLTLFTALPFKKSAVLMLLVSHTMFTMDFSIETAICYSTVYLTKPTKVTFNWFTYSDASPSPILLTNALL